MTQRTLTTDPAHRAEPEPPGAAAESPTEIPPRGWLQVVRRAWKESSNDQVPLLAAGVAFYTFLSLVPAMIAAVLLYGLVLSPADVQSQVDKLSGTLPQAARTLVRTQLEAITSTSSSSLGIGLVISLLLALWSASGGVGNVVTAINIAYDEDETRGFVRRKALSLALTLAGIVFVVVILALVAVTPALLDHLVGGGPLRWGFEALRWVALLVAMSAALAVLYRVAPDRDDAQVRWVSLGAVVATILWLVGSLGFSLYVDHFSSYNKTYGALAGVVVLLLWLWLTIFIVLLGAEINAEAEQQTAKDTTVGRPRPMGQRNAVKADSPPGDAGE